MSKDALAKLREPFTEGQIGKLPKPYKKESAKGSCRECGGYHGLPAAHLSYVGHAALTDRFLDVDPEWSWEPVALDQNGLPAFDGNGGLWIKLTICGVTRLGYGDAEGKRGGNAIKEAIGDALRNAGMRFGAALDLWHKGDLHDAEVEKGTAPIPTTADLVRAAKVELAELLKASGIDVDAFLRWALTPNGGGINLAAVETQQPVRKLIDRVKKDADTIGKEIIAMREEALNA